MRPAVSSAASSSSSSGTTRRHQPDVIGLGRVDDPARQHQLPCRGSRRSSRGSSQLTPMSQPDKPDAHERHVEAGRRTGDADVAAERERQPAARGGTVHRGDDRHRQRPQVGDQRGDVGLRREARPGPDRVLRRPVACRSPVRSSPAQNPRPAPVSTIDRHARSAATVVERAVQVGDQLGVHGVELVGPVERELGDALTWPRHDQRRGGGHGSLAESGRPIGLGKVMTPLSRTASLSG